MTTCPIHRTPLVRVEFCPRCRGQAGGRAKSAAKTRAVRLNATRPRPRVVPPVTRRHTVTDDSS